MVLNMLFVLLGVTFFLGRKSFLSPYSLLLIVYWNFVPTLMNMRQRGSHIIGPGKVTYEGSSSAQRHDAHTRFSVVPRTLWMAVPFTALFKPKTWDSVLIFPLPLLLAIHPEYGSSATATSQKYLVSVNWYPALLPLVQTIIISHLGFYSISLHWYTFVALQPVLP